MSNLASLNVKIDRNVKKEADFVANSMGMTLSTAINVFVRQMVSEHAIPFRIQIIDGNSRQFTQLIDDIRTENKETGFLSDEEINNEIDEYRRERQHGKS
jgi:DNA-damage-inducible protein J